MSKRYKAKRRMAYHIRKFTGLEPHEFTSQYLPSESCWCGVKNPYYAPVHHQTCGGMGIIDCHCGGDLCVCHNHGEVECFGCEDCEPDGDDDECGDDDGRNE